MVKIRLLRVGAKKRPFYRIVAVDERRKGDGCHLEWLGTYDPLAAPPRLRVRHAEIEAWVGKGARLSDSVRSIVKQSRKAGGAQAVST
ncbi:MAG TPA: 30S ribosomal protein S16 [Myxococcota bacterium]|nr:30S ribosomal protein S16 [Myxococcota bacterium]